MFVRLGGLFRLEQSDLTYLAEVAVADSDGGCRQAEVFTWEGRREMGQGCDGTRGVGAGVAGRERKCGVWEIESRGSQGLQLHIPLYKVLTNGYRVESNFTQASALTRTKCSHTDCRLFS